MLTIAGLLLGWVIVRGGAGTSGTSPANDDSYHLPVVALNDLINNPERLRDKTFIIDRVEISGEIKRQQAHTGYHVKVYLGSDKKTYQINQDWNGFIISKAMGGELLNDSSYPCRAIVMMTCHLKKKNKWAVQILRLDFLDESGQVVKTVK